MTDLSRLMREAQEMQEKIAAAQQEVEALRVEGAAGGGLVRVTLSGKHQLVAVVIDPSLLKSEDSELLEDLIKAAHEDARKKLEDAQGAAIEAATSRFSGMLPGFKLPF